MPALLALVILTAMLATVPVGRAVAQEREIGAATPRAMESRAPAAQEPEHGAAARQERQEEHGAEEPGEGEHAGPSWLDYTFKWINFVMLLGLLYWLLVVPPPFVIESFGFPGLKVLLRERSSEIVAARDLAREQISAAKTTAAESEARLQRVEEEAGALLGEAADDARQERQRIVAAAEQEAERIRAHAQRDMGAEVTRARRELKEHVADLSVGMAADIVKNDLSPEDQDRLVREYLDRLGQTVA